MAKKIALLVFLLISLNLFAQTERKVSLSLLANDKIADVNVDKDSYIKYIGAITDFMEKEFQGVSNDQKVALLFISHKTGKPTLELYSTPKLTDEKEKHFLQGINSMNHENTKLVDFPMLVTINIEKGVADDYFKDIVLPTEKTIDEYKSAGLKRKYELNKTWAVTEVLPVLCAYQVIVDDKFAGVKNFGMLVAKTNFEETQDVLKLTSTNSDYWRAIMEMEVGNQLIPATKIFMHVSQGEFDIALKYLEIVKLFSNAKTTANTYLNELTQRLKFFNQELSNEIGAGITEHDKGDYKKAVETYNTVLNKYPNSAWALYELYFSQNALDLKNNKIKLEDRRDWDIAKVKIYKCNPLYTMDVRASNAKETYLLFRRMEINDLFKSKEGTLDDIYKYADIAMDLSIYDFAAQLFWNSYTYSGGKNEMALNKYLYCLEKQGVTNLKENFKGDFKKEFAQIEKDKEKEMKNSSLYKSSKEK